MPDPRILIGTLYVDENERARCEQALAAQSYTDWDQTILSGLENRDAHRTLYQLFMDRHDDYGLFIKLDADMVLNSPEALKHIVAEFVKAADLDHAVFMVHDWMSDLSIIGLHVFSCRVSWRRSEEDLFVDPDPDRPGQKRVFEGYPSPIADHSPDPSPFQAFRFGVHRASKILQDARWWIDSAQADFQWQLLTAILATWQRAGDRRRLLALLGAQWVLTGRPARIPASYTDRGVREAFAQLEPLDDDRLAELLSPAWQHGIGRFWLRYRRTPLRSVTSRMGRAGVRLARTLRHSLSPHA